MENLEDICLEKCVLYVVCTLKKEDCKPLQDYKTNKVLLISEEYRKQVCNKWQEQYKEENPYYLVKRK